MIGFHATELSSWHAYAQYMWCSFYAEKIYDIYINGFMQERCNSIALAFFFCINALNYYII